MQYIVSIEGQNIPLPEEIATDDAKVRQALAPFYPDAANAMITRTAKDDVTTVNVVKKAGSKGMGRRRIQAPADRLDACKGGMNPVNALLWELQQTEGELSITDMLSLDERIDRALDAGQKQAHQVDKALAYLSEALPQPAPVVVLGF